MSNESKPFSERLDEIEARAKDHAIRNTGCKCALCHSIIENLSLVKALRRAVGMIETDANSTDVLATFLDDRKEELARLLTLPVEQQQQKNLEESGDV